MPKINWEEGTETEYTLFLVKHMQNPCEEPQTGLNLRGFYLRMAQSFYRVIKNPDLKEFLGIELSIAESFHREESERWGNYKS